MAPTKAGQTAFKYPSFCGTGDTSVAILDQASFFFMDPAIAAAVAALGILPELESDSDQSEIVDEAVRAALSVGQPLSRRKCCEKASSEIVWAQPIKNKPLISPPPHQGRRAGSAGGFRFCRGVLD